MKKHTIYSIDNYGWSTDKIDYDTADAFAGIYDKNNRPLFENDIVSLRVALKPIKKKGFV